MTSRPFTRHLTICGELRLTLSDVTPDVELQLFHALVHLISEHLLFATIDHDHHFGTQTVVRLSYSKIIH